MTLLLIKSYIIVLPILLLLFCISFCICRYHFLKLFGTSFNIRKKIFVTNFSFLTDSPNSPALPTAEIRWTWQKFFADAPLAKGINDLVSMKHAIQNNSAYREYLRWIFFWSLLSRIFTIRRTVEGGGGESHKRSLPLPPASPTLAH